MMNPLSGYCRSRSAVPTGRWALLAFLLVSLFLRSAIPVGYMPGMSPGEDRTFSLVLCSMDGPVKTIMLDLGDDGVSSAPDDVVGSSPCLFASVVTQVALSAALGILSVPQRDGVETLRDIHPVPIATFTAGAPLGPRPPPLL